jgi:mannose/cellobiose epimerase-like protein (N-acyl-D-glucosamine 2-epimerase family)
MAGNRRWKIPQAGSVVDSQCLLGMAKLAEGMTILLDIDRLMHIQETVVIGETA